MEFSILFIVYVQTDPRKSPHITHTYPAEKALIDSEGANFAQSIQEFFSTVLHINISRMRSEGFLFYILGVWGWGHVRWAPFWYPQDQHFRHVVLRVFCESHCEM